MSSSEDILKKGEALLQSWKEASSKLKKHEELVTLNPIIEAGYQYILVAEICQRLDKLCETLERKLDVKK